MSKSAKLIESYKFDKNQSIENQNREISTSIATDIEKKSSSTIEFKLRSISVSNNLLAAEDVNNYSKFQHYSKFQPEPNYNGEINNNNFSSNLQKAPADEVNQFIRLAANIVEAHTVSLLVPTKYIVQQDPELTNLESSNTSSGQHKTIIDENYALLCIHTLSPESTIQPGYLVQSGPLLWVAKTQKSLHVSPYENEAQALGIYTKKVGIKSIAAVPVKLPLIPTISSYINANNKTPTNPENIEFFTGILAVDSLKQYRFTALQIKLLSQLAESLTDTLMLKEQLKYKSSILVEFAAEDNSLQSAENNLTVGKQTSYYRKKIKPKYSSLLNAISNVEAKEEILRLDRSLGKNSLSLIKIAVSTPNYDQLPSALRQQLSLVDFLRDMDYLYESWESLLELAYCSVKLEAENQIAGKTTVRQMNNELNSFAPDKPNLFCRVVNGTLFILCDRLMVATLKERLISSFRFTLRKLLYPELSDINALRFKLLESQVQIFTEKMSNLNNNTDSFTTEISRLLK